MSLRQDIAYFARECKIDNEFSYGDLESLTGLTRKQISAILNAKTGVSFDKIEKFFIDAFDVELGIVLGEKLNGLE